MKKHQLSASIITLSVLIATVHIYALVNASYWQYAWLDIVMHFSGGLLVGMFFLWIYGRYAQDLFFSTSRGTIFLQMILFVTFVGFIWESFEVLLGLPFTTRAQYFGDTSLDFVMNTIGTLSAYYYARPLIVAKPPVHV